jgi:hypothetical protein
MKLRQAWFTPFFSTLLQDRLVARVLLGAGALQLGLSLLGLPGWACPIKTVLGIPCPGCGLTRAMGELLSGDWRHALSTHAFAPIFLLAGAILLAVTLLPNTPRTATISFISAFEKRTGISALVLISLLVYWCVRLSGLVQVG